MSEIGTGNGLACVRCGYDLRGVTSLDAPCPECGLAAHRSAAAGESLGDCPAAWVMSIARGAALVAIAYCGPMFMAATSALGLLDGSRYHRLIAIEAYLVVHVFGVFLVTRREPGGKRRTLLDRLEAWALRLCAAMPAVAMPLSMYAEVSGRWWQFSDALAVMGLGALACPALVAIRLRRLACRVGRPRVAEHAVIAGVGLSIAAIAATLLNAFAGRNQAVSWIAAASIAAGACYLWLLWMLWMIAINLRAAAQHARAAWHDADAASDTMRG